MSEQSENNSLTGKATVSETWDLYALSPSYEDSQHREYVRAVIEAVYRPGIHNIALSGSYGVGKSSVLRQVTAELNAIAKESRQKTPERVVELSLSTLAPFKDSDLDDAVPKQAGTTTNQIQQEIVKQLLYREDSVKTPGSRFRRIERFRLWRELPAAGLAALLISLIFLLTGWSEKVNQAMAPNVDPGAWLHLLVFLVSFGIFFYLRWLTFGRIHIKQFSTGSATVTLDEESVSFFDQYLDEIVYFFEVSGRDIVVFEDIDRFEDIHIFETLRALNNLLNSAPQIRGPIRFIYAVKDSIFDHSRLKENGRHDEVEAEGAVDSATKEARRANRTKFFELIIPVVPFITHRTARSHAVTLLEHIAHDVKPELFDVVANYIPDMRLLKNVRNEFVVFRDRILSGDGAELKLTDTELFAMMLYKSTHLLDFESIRSGNSNLDKLYAKQRELVAGNIKRVERELRESRNRLRQIDSVKSRSQHLGERLTAHMKRTADAIGLPWSNPTFTFNGADWTESELTQPDFWNELVESEAEATLEWRNSSRQSLNFTRSSLVEALNNPIDLVAWQKLDRARVNEEISEKQETLAFLKGANFRELIERPDFLVQHNGSEQSFDLIAQDLLGSGLAYQLLYAGHIGSNFTLYTSTFHGNRGGAPAVNFAVHHLERDRMDVNFELTPEDAEAVVRDHPRSLGESAMYNIAILDHLLEKDPTGADTVIRSLSTYGQRQVQFIQAYLSGGARRKKLVERLTFYSPRILRHLTNREAVELDVEARLRFINHALTNLNPESRYLTDENVAEFLAENYAELPVMHSDQTSVETAGLISAVYDKAGVHAEHLSVLGENMRTEFLRLKLYPLSLENLRTVMGADGSLALDHILSVNEHVFQYLIDNVGTYLSLTEGVSGTVDQPDNFVQIIEAVLEHEGTSNLLSLVQRAAKNCAVSELEKAPEEAWPVLAYDSRFPTSFRNISAYVEHLGSIDENVARALQNSGVVLDVEDVPEDSKLMLARQILSARDVLESARVRVQLVTSLNLQAPLEVATIKPENGDLFARLLEAELIEDTDATYEYLETSDWASRESFIRSSFKFASYMTPILLGNDLANFFRSEIIKPALKEQIVGSAAEYAEKSDESGLIAMASYAFQNELSLSTDVIERCATAGASSREIIGLLEEHLEMIEPNQLFNILRDLGGTYAQLTSYGRDKPKIPSTRSDKALLARLKSLDLVASIKPDGDLIRVSKRYKEGR